jgi:hypothetical protein
LQMTFSQTEKDVAWTTMLKTDLPELAGAYFDTSANQRDLSMGSLLWNKYINWRHRSVLPNISDAVYDYIIRFVFMSFIKTWSKHRFVL